MLADRSRNVPIMKNDIFLQEKLLNFRLFSLILLLGFCLVAPSWTSSLSVEFQGHLRIKFPPQWLIIKQENNTILLKRENEQTVCHLISWEIPRGGLPQAWAAALAYECLLYEQRPYRRLSNETISTTNGLEWHIVCGETLGEHKQIIPIYFGASAAAGRYWILQPELPLNAEYATHSQQCRELIAGIEFIDTKSSSQISPSANDASTPVAIPTKPLPIPAAPPMFHSRLSGAAPLASDEALAAPQPFKALPEQPLSKPVPELARPEPSTASLPTKPSTPQTINSNPAPADESSKPDYRAKDPLPGRQIQNKEDDKEQLPYTPALKRINNVAAASVRPDPPSFVQFFSPFGFSLELPESWEAIVTQGRILVQPSSQARQRTALPFPQAIIWPVAHLPEGQEPSSLALELLGRCNLEKSQLAALRRRSLGQLALLAGEISKLQEPHKLVACCHVQGHQGLLTALIAPIKEFQAYLPILLRVLNSFQGGPWLAELSESPREIWQDPVKGWLRVPVPQGWRVRGQLLYANGRWGLSVDLEDTSAQRLRCVWRQPVLPLFRELTPALRNLGWQEGDRYPSNTPGDYLRLLPFMAPSEFVQRYWLSAGPYRLLEPVIEQTSCAAELTPLVAAPEATALRVLLRGKREGEERQRLCFVATGKAEINGETACWQAAILEADAPAGAIGALDKAQRILFEAIMGATLSPEAPAEAHATLASAKAACTAYWGLYAPQENVKFLDDVFTASSPRKTGRVWLFNPASLEPWRQAWRAMQAGQPLHSVMPELD